MDRKGAQHGVSFQTDLSQVGGSRSSKLLSGGASVLDEERRLIEKVFSIIDQDNSGKIDMSELKAMFDLFNIDSHFLTNALQRVMSNVDANHDGMIDPQEFYKMLSQTFEKGDSKADVKSVFDRMDKDKNGRLDVDELHEVAKTLGDTMSKAEIKDMIKTFNKQYQEELRRYNEIKKKDPHAKEPDEPHAITLDDFYDVMQEEL
mmetsp:Transcript_39144/g.110648  ORF Transcript_39144/g.110648 Transcript_39144/m.110648 type:complete len:204 (+) Transcript_39144:116-727(+)|eukprot:CAMPEP_0179244068 /NCGR_PEP_ID=MMETSP0797-20121207/17866_1 /TAXON_ID=47934 /ORGANISM="Dinophysis acuminata, Strain DAEP01" /LENGTH=203 /DNA_ID=CAMNT_0020951571 /DNA_START=89 /DNA_END=700 /DNA_ORIENTATION=-